MLANRLLRAATSASWNGIVRPCRTTVAPILISFSRSVVSDHCSTASGKASVGGKLRRLSAQRAPLRTYLVDAEAVARKPGPVDRVPALTYALLRRAALSVEGHPPLGLPAEIGDHEADTGKKFAGVPRHLGHDAVGLVPAIGPVAEAGGSAPRRPLSLSVDDRLQHLAPAIGGVPVAGT